MSREITYKHRIKSSFSDAESYSKRKKSRHDAEMRLIGKTLPFLMDTSTVLDIPCGAGRASIMLAECGFETTGADIGEGAVEFATQAIKNAEVNAKAEKADIENLFYKDNSFDAILCFRMFHHFPSEEIRSRVISELCRVAQNYVIISYLSPFAFTSIRRSLQYKLFGKKYIQHSISLKKLKNYFNAQNFSLVKDFAQMPFFHTLHLAIFRKS